MRRLAMIALATACLAVLAAAPTGALAQNGTDQTDETPQQAPPEAGPFQVDCNELKCTFDASEARFPNTTIERYAWDFGDGASAEGAIANHTYHDVGTYEVQLTLEGEDGSTANRTRTLNVTADRPDAQGTVPWSSLGIGSAALVASILIARMT